MEKGAISETVSSKRLTGGNRSSEVITVGKKQPKVHAT